MPKVSEQYRDARRAAIMDAARRCFARDGFHQTSMQDLFAETGLSSGAVYRYFPSKASMIVAIARENMADLVTMLHAATTGADDRSFGEVVAQLLETFRDRHRETSIGTIALTVWAEAIRDEEISAAIGAAAADVRSELVALAQRQQSAARLSERVSPDAVAASVLALVPGYIMQLTVNGEDAVAAVPDAVRAMWGDETSH